MPRVIVILSFCRPFLSNCYSFVYSWLTGMV
jgi:hypothetical protein